jgi:hypothetical protein
MSPIQYQWKEIASKSLTSPTTFTGLGITHLHSSLHILIYFKNEVKISIQGRENRPRLGGYVKGDEEVRERRIEYTSYTRKGV